MDYESNIDLLNQIMQKLENEKLPLAQEVELYKKAYELYVECDEYLENAKGSIYKIKKDLETYKEEKLIKGEY